MTFDHVMNELKDLGDEQTKKTLMRHGAKEPFFGVKVGDLKKILKKTKKNHELSLELFASGNSDAMYLAGLMADETKISKETLNEWVRDAYWYYLSEFTVPWVAAETPFGFDLAMQWIKSDKENIAAAGWSTLASIAGYKQDCEIDIMEYDKLLDYVEKNIHNAQNRVKYTMNGFVISVGTYLESLSEKAISIAKKNGKISVIMEGTSCKVPDAIDHIKKAKERTKPGKKRNSARC